MFVPPTMIAKKSTASITVLGIRGPKKGSEQEQFEIDGMEGSRYADARLASVRMNNRSVRMEEISTVGIDLAKSVF